MPFRHFLYFFPRLSTLLILTILRHLSLKPGHIAHFNTLYALHVPQTRTHCTFLILVDSDWSLSLKKVDSGLTLLLV